MGVDKVSNEVVWIVESAAVGLDGTLRLLSTLRVVKV